MLPGSSPLADSTETAADPGYDLRAVRKREPIKLLISTISKEFLRISIQYFDPTLIPFLHCESSGRGLGICLMQNWQHVAYASRSLTDTKVSCTQMEKESQRYEFDVEYVYRTQLIWRMLSDYSSFISPKSHTRRRTKLRDTRGSGC